MLPMWHYCQEIESISDDKVLIFGGGLKEVYSFDFQLNMVSEVTVHENGSSSPDSPTKSPDSPTNSSGKKLQIDRDDWFIA